MSSMVAKLLPLRHILRGENSQKPLGAKSGQYGGWAMKQQAMCGSVSYRDAETTCRAASSAKLSQ
jgi:hypothetical protein